MIKLNTANILPFPKTKPTLALLFKSRILISTLLLFTFCVIIAYFILFTAFLSSNKIDSRLTSITNYTGVSLVEVDKQDIYKNKNGIVWHDNNKEIEFDGTFYEVVYTRSLKYKVKVYVIKDEKESNLIASFYKDLKKNKTNLFNFFSFLFSLNFLSKGFNFNMMQPESGASKYLSKILFSLFNFHSDLIKPPARI